MDGYWRLFCSVFVSILLAVLVAGDDQNSTPSSNKPISQPTIINFHNTSSNTR